MRTEFDSGNAETKVTGSVLVVDDSSTTRTIYRMALTTQFDVETASSGDQALKICKEHLPDLVLLDVNMPDMDGYETCCKLREFTDIPIVFITSNESLEEHLRAFDAGGDDIIVKPVSKDILLRKASLTIQRKNLQSRLESEKTTLQSMPMNFLSALGEQGVVQRFMQASLSCNTAEALGQRLVDAIKDYGLQCSVLIRVDGQTLIMTSHGQPKAIECSILEHVTDIGRIFQFQKKMVVNYDHVSVIVKNMPEEESETSGRVRDNVVLLAELSDTLCGNVAMRQNSHAMPENPQAAMSTAFVETESLLALGQRTRIDIHLLLQELVDNVEKTYSWLGIGRTQEASINKTIYASVEKILSLLESTSDQSDEKFNRIQFILRGGNSDAQETKRIDPQ